MQRLPNYPDIRIDSTHSRAICEEVGHRLRQRLGNVPADNPRHRSLLDQLRLQDVPRLSDVDGSPSIVPSFRDADAGGGPTGTPAPLRKGNP
jgi:hypothetical protein